MCGCVFMFITKQQVHNKPNWHYSHVHNSMFTTNQLKSNRHANCNSSGPKHYKPHIVQKALDYKFRPPTLHSIHCSQKTLHSKATLFFLPCCLLFGGCLLGLGCQLLFLWSHLLRWFHSYWR